MPPSLRCGVGIQRAARSMSRGHSRGTPTDTLPCAAVRDITLDDPHANTRARLRRARTGTEDVGRANSGRPSFGRTRLAQYGDPLNVALSACAYAATVAGSA